MEDFGYQKDGENEKFSGMMRKVVLSCAALFSLALFIYITVNAYYFVYYDKDNDIEVIKAPEGVIKEVAEETVDGENAAQMHTIYQDIFGNGREADVKNAKIRKAPEPAIPSKNAELDRRLIKGSFSAEKKADAAAANAQSAADLAQQQNVMPNKSRADELEQDQSQAGKQTKKDKRSPIRVQIAAMTSKEAAKEYWQKISGTNSSIFSGLKPFVEEVDLGKRGVFFRLQIGNFFNQPDAEEFCSRYVAQAKKSRADCIIVE